ncbi:hypothetical protein FNZ56_02905 [Pseudoluteimonas lycopersici]|uniref:Uncharacterized protein n=1 Tax=Pseudoluteimonas lycopersici TaxID=1324796 RepID=A0A516V2Z9_9GAMM|nr:hypothetical protein [Lysobacter lycopersici]QDQ72900.1 hypothetical protein FNZ56_02905 [Lysobacter lycopersici]
MQTLTCLDDPPPAPGGSCTTTAWVEAPSLVPPLSIDDAQTIAYAFLGALVAVMVVKIIGKKTQ